MFLHIEGFVLGVRVSYKKVIKLSSLHLTRNKSDAFLFYKHFLAYLALEYYPNTKTTPQIPLNLNVKSHDNSMCRLMTPAVYIL